MTQRVSTYPPEIYCKDDIYDILIILESDNMQEIKRAIDVDLHNIDGINNLTSLISVN